MHLKQLLGRCAQQYERTGKLWLKPSTRVSILDAVGPRTEVSRTSGWDVKNFVKRRTEADFCRARIYLFTARRTESLWLQACKETTDLFGYEAEYLYYEAQMQPDYFERRRDGRFEEIETGLVPRRHHVRHVLDMTERALADEIHDYERFTHNANELWVMYGTYGWWPREYYIHSASQAALYYSIGGKLTAEQANCADAMTAYAGVFWLNSANHTEERIDVTRRSRFWYWWVTEAVPQACLL
jgi:hypothetical protein